MFRIMKKEIEEMCEKVEINSPEEMEEFINSATKEELIILKEDLLNGAAFEDD